MILIVDDKPENVLSLQKTLELHGFQVDTALSGEEALKKILKHSYALIILDVQMPSMDGFEVAETVSGYSKAKDVPIIFLSAVNKEKKFITKGYASGGIDYITKPVDPDILLLKVKTLYKMYEQTKQLQDMHRSLQEEVEVRKDAQAALRAKVQELHSILESLPQLAFTASADGDVEYANQHWFNYSPSLKQFPETAVSSTTIGDLWRNAVKLGQPLETEVYLKDLHQQHYRCHLLRAIPLKEGKEVIKWVGTFTDIAYQKQANEILEQRVEERTRELQEMNHALEVSNHDLQQFASVASHDLKEPLRKIQLFGAILRDKHLVQDPDALQYMDRIVSSSERMTRLISDLLNFSRLSAHHDFERTDLNLIITDILADLELSIHDATAEVIVDQLPHIDAVPGQIRQAFQNIISNALKFRRPGVKPVIHISATLIAEKAIDSLPACDGRYCRILIADNGIGFNEKYLSKIFTLFQRLHSKEEYEGTGIGLAIAKKVVEKHQGLITASSREHEGATFVIVLPVSQENTTLADTSLHAAVNNA
ncbi:response regulator [Chitinophaga pendula]|uniref:hybrid sensor histidine kinase/response regulator n=1 Tax=Chitinophaga TaxID=79328 RepID=UPI000BAFF8B0|nr:MULTISPECIES: response regulator [Chitinophaga]ASZ13372.1 hybrid sensor histidine kinase/response regulator [Chitinophaga sp. MD30]UCJ09006.1 response regulator [Chitinophaga pendula]